MVLLWLLLSYASCVDTKDVAPEFTALVKVTGLSCPVVKKPPPPPPPPAPPDYVI